MASDKVMVLNDYGKFKATQHTRSSGKSRTTIEIHAEAVGVVVDDVAAGIRNTTTIASAATRLYRQEAKRAFDRGARWAHKRYSGGKIGPRAPDPTSVRFGNDSGRLAVGIAARYAPAVASWMVNVPANRLTADQPTLRARMLEWLEPIVNSALKQESIQDAVRQTLKGMVGKAKDTRADLEAQLLSALKQSLSNLEQLGGQLDELAEEPEPERPGR
jgi:hypothetical protein